MRLDAEEIVERLAHTRPPTNPRIVELPKTVIDWPADLAASLAEELTPAGVLIPMLERKTGITVLLTERSAELRHHAGQIAFPGGRMEPDDADVTATALRETEEEVGIPAGRVRVSGFLPPMPTITGYAVTPVVGLLKTPLSLVIDRGEVSSAFEVPLDFLLDPGNEQRGTRQYQGREIPVVEYRFERHRIWGATAHMIQQLRVTIVGQ